MIRNESEYRAAIGRLAEEKKRIARRKAELQKMHLSPQEVKRVIDPMRSFHLQLQEEVEGYERLKRGEFEELRNLRARPTADRPSHRARDQPASACRKARRA